MAKKAKKQHKRASLNKLARQAAEPLAAAAEQPLVHPGAHPIREVFVITGGTADKPVRENAASVPAVTSEEISKYGNDRKRVTVGLAMNILGGVGIPRDVMNKDAPCWSERAVRTDKMAFFKIMESGLTAAQCADAWNQTLKERKRYDAPTLQALSKAVRAYKILGGLLEPRVSPMEKFARDMLGIMNNRTLTQEEILREIRAKLTEKANYDAQQPAPAVRAA